MSSPAGREAHGVPDAVLRRRLFIQLLVFLILEFAFVSLAIACVFHPILCNLPVPSTQAKAGLTVVFIIWHTLATMNASNIVLHGFSSEWYIRFRKKAALIPDDTDRVSTITSGILTSFKYFWSPDASITYRLSFLALWALVALGSIGPGTINLDDVPSFSPTKINVTNFTVTGGDTDDPVLLNPVVRSSLVVDLEQRMQSPFGFNTQENMIVGWPNISTSNLSGDLVFRSDVLAFNMTCWWERPSVNTTIWQTTWSAGGYVWYPWDTPLPDTEFSGGLMTMYRFAIDQAMAHDHPTSVDYPDPINAAAPPLGMSGYIFFGENSSIAGVESDAGHDNKTHRALNLDGLPTLYNPNGFNFTDIGNATGHFRTPLATFLLCDPQARIMDGEVSLSQRDNNLTVSSVTPVADGGKPMVGNISPDTANVVLGLILMDALENDDDTASFRIGVSATEVFLDSSKQALPLADIQKNLTKFLNSAAKALSSYIRDYDEDPGSTDSPLFLVEVGGAVQSPKMALVANIGLLSPTIALVVLVTAVLLVEFFWIRVWEVPGFKLESLIKYGQAGRKAAEKKDGVVSDLTTAVAVKGSFQRPSLRNLFLGLLTFTILELAFTILAFSCISNPIFVSIPISASYVRGGFTILSILWHTLALFLLSGATAFAFSSEWSLRRNREKSITPGETDCVSRVTSGGPDRARYFFFSKKPSLTFRVAFVLSIMMVLLNSFAPGSVSVDKTRRDTRMQVNVADLKNVTSNQDDGNLDFLTDRTFTLAMMEHHEDTVFRYEVEPGWVVPWVDKASVDASVVGDIEYPTDVVRFNHSCKWVLPEVKPGKEDTKWIVEGQSWELWDEPLEDQLYRGGILPMYRYLDVQPDAKTAYLFIGTNDSLPVGKHKAALNLNNLPTLFHPSGLVINNSDTGTSLWSAPLSTILVCDPQVQVSGGRARLSATGQLRTIHSGDEPMGNFPLEAVNTIFTRSPLETLDTGDDTFEVWVTILSARVFLSNTSLEFDNFEHGVPLHDLSTINANLDGMLLSGAKAFTDGLHMDEADQSKIAASTKLVMGMGQVEQLALVGTRSLAITSMVLWILVVFAFGWLVFLIARGEGVAFTLRNLMEVLSDEGRSLSFMDV